MTKNDIPVTPAVRLLRDNGIEFVPYEYHYEEKGGTAQTARELNVDEHLVIKTLVLEADASVFLMLMHGDKEVSLKELARVLGVKAVHPCDSKKAMNATGYMFGGTSPFGTKKNLSLCVEESIFNLDKIFINGGKRGFIVGIKPDVLKKLFKVSLVNVAI